MTQQATSFGRDIYLRHTGTDGNSFIAHHRAWDADRMLEHRRREAANANADVKGDKSRLAKVEQITEDQYLAERRAK
jgi:hypothetical protein